MRIPPVRTSFFVSIIILSSGCSSASAASPCGASCVGSLPLPGCSVLVRERAAGTNTGCGQTRTVVVRNECEHKEDVKIISII
ncbi:hypothetical protein B0H10DRAFT_2043799 [Mycena sp. CBHHK59/15]|nr:hypothetical protein B0H10DRAFT_2043799 [Mycena sp. CBHHK59/15]